MRYNAKKAATVAILAAAASTSGINLAFAQSNEPVNIPNPANSPQTNQTQNQNWQNHDPNQSSQNQTRDGQNSNNDKNIQSDHRDNAKDIRDHNNYDRRDKKDDHYNKDDQNYITGRVTSRDRDSLTLQRGNRKFTVDINDNTKIVGAKRNHDGNRKSLDFRDIDEGDRVMTVGSKHHDSIDAWRIVDISK